MTPHAIDIVGEDNLIIKTFPKGEKMIRLAASTVLAFEKDNIRFTKTVFGQAEGLPEYQEGIHYIVSQIVKSAFPERSDLLVPAEVQRNSEGNIIGCKSLGV